jgi:hypothetical protein
MHRALLRPLMRNGPFILFCYAGFIATIIWLVTDGLPPG